MIKISLKVGGHKWEKKNLVTIEGRRGYDIYRCSMCGIEGKSYQLGSIEIPEKYKHKINKCKVANKNVYTKVRVKKINAFGKLFANITPGSVHEIVSPPPGETNERGEWVMGVGEPVLLLAEEYTYINE